MLATQDNYTLSRKIADWTTLPLSTQQMRELEGLVNSHMKQFTAIVEMLTHAIKDAHPHIGNDSIRAKAGAAIVIADDFMKGL